jgi:hypothetical protein
MTSGSAVISSGEFHTVVVRPFKVVQSRPGTRLKPRTTFLPYDLLFEL